MKNDLGLSENWQHRRVRIRHDVMSSRYVMEPVCGMQFGAILGIRNLLKFVACVIYSI